MSAVISEPKATLRPAPGKTWGQLGDVLRHLRANYKEWGISGVWEPCWRLFGVMLSYSHHQKVVHALSSPQSRPFGEVYPRLAYRYTLPYLSTDFGWSTRRSLLLAHYSFVNARISQEFAGRVMNQNMVVWSEDVQGQQLRVRIDGLCPVTRHREGELTLRFECNGKALYFLSFSIVRAASLPLCPGGRPDPDAHVFYIGRVQGAPGEMDAIREVTALMGQVAPPDVLMAALAGLAEALGVSALVGVGAQTCISSHTIKGSLSRFDYAAFWTRFGGRPLPGDHTLMTLPMDERPIQEISSRHRKRTLTKRAFKAEVSALAAAAMRPFVHGR